MDKLENMRTFVQVVDSWSFSRAAELMDLPKSTVTRQVQALESELGVKLLHRTSRRLSMTEQGEAYYHGAIRLLSQMEILDSNVQAAAQAPRGKIRVEMPNAIAYRRVIPALPGFLMHYPDVQVEVSVGNRTADLIAQNIDCVIRIGELHNDALIARSLGVLPMITCAAPAYLQKHGVPEHPQDLIRDHTLVQIASPQTGRVFEHQVFKDEQSVTVRGRWQFSVNDSTAALTGAIAGLGVLTTYRFLAQEALDNGALVPLFPEWADEQVPVHVAWPENRHLPSKVRYFIEWVRALFQE